MEEIKTNKISQKNPKREALKGLSKIAKKLQDTEYPEMSINQILLDIIYQPKEGDKLTFDTFNGWRKKGKRVKKGEKAFLIWGRKREATKQEKEEESNSFKFFPLAFVFSDKQVENYIVHEDDITGFQNLEENEEPHKRFTAESEIF